MKKFINEQIVPLLAFAMIYFMAITTRFRYFNREFEAGVADKPTIYALWHNRFLPFMYIYGFHRNFAAIISPSDDGEYVARTMRLFGFKTVRGSSYQNGAKALLRMVRQLEEGHGTIIADGSRGPRYKVQPGVIQLAKLSQAPILPLTMAAGRKKVFEKSWDKFILPLPFGRINVYYGEPVIVPRDANDAVLEQKRLELEDRLNTITQEADRGFK